MVLLLAIAAVAPTASATIPDPIIAIDLNIQQNQPQPPNVALPIWNSAYDWSNSHGYNTWTATKQTALPEGYELRQGYSNKPGLWLWPKGSFALGGLFPKLYPPGYAEFSYAAPGTTRIARASLETEYRSALYLTHCTEFGLRVGTTSRSRNRDCIAPAPDRIEIGMGGEKSFRKVALFDPSDAPTAKDLYVKIDVPKCPPLPDSACSKLVTGGDPLTGGAYLRANKVSLTLVDDDLPIVTTSGAFYDLAGKYIDGKESYPLTISDDDSGAGIKHTQLDHEEPTPPGTPDALAAKPASCDITHNTAAFGSRICPQADSLASTVDTNSFPEGTNKLRAWAADPANNVGERRWNVIVDRTAPEAPDDIYFLTPAKGSAQVYWDEAIDPALADETRPSGTSHYRFRSKTGSGNWTNWSEVSRSRQLSNEVTGQPSGTTVTFEVVAVDAVGNASLPATMTGVVHDPDEDSPTDGSGTPDDPALDVSAPGSAEGAEAQDSSPARVPTGAVPISLNITNGSTPPAITPPIWNSAYPWQQGVGYNEWTPNIGSTLTNGYELKRGHAGRPGLWLWPVGSSAAGNKLYPPGYAEFAFTAPGTTRIARASVDLAYRSVLYASHCTEIGLRIGTLLRAANTNCIAPVPDQVAIDPHGTTSYRNVPLFDPSSKPTAKEAYARIFIPSCQLLSIELCSKLIPSQDPLHFGPYLQVRSVTMTLVDDDRPVVETSGSFSDLNGKYVDGSQNYQLATSEADAGAGIASTQIDHAMPAPSSQTSSLSTKPAACDLAHNTAALGSSICPANDALIIPVNTTTFPEGRNRIRVWSIDTAGNVGEKKLSVIVDRTAPPAPKVRPIRADEGSAQVYWDEAVDPALPDGSRGSTTNSYRFRSKVSDRSWTDWKEVPRSQQISDEVFDKPIGTVVSFEVSSVDAVGNTSAASAVSITVRGKLPTNAIGGELGALDGEYTQGRSPVLASITATDDEAGVDSVLLASPTAPFNATRSAPCGLGQQRYSVGKRDCPKLFVPEILVPFQDFPEGRHTFTSATNGRTTNANNSSVSMSIDRTAPAPPPFESLEAIFDDEDGVAQISWQPGADPNLPDGTAGSGTTSFEYRFRQDGGSWTNWTPTSENGFESGPSAIGQQIEVEVRSVDDVGNTSDPLSSSVSVSAGACYDGDADGDDSIGVGLHQGMLQDNAEVISFTLAQSVSQATLLSTLPTGADVVSAIERSDLPYSSVHTTGLALAEEQSLTDGFELMNVYMERDLDQLEAQYQDAIETASDREAARLDRELSIVEEQRALYARSGGVPIRSFAITNDPTVADQVRSAFAGQLLPDGPTPVSGAAECDFDNAVSTSPASMSRMASNGSNQRLTTSALVGQKIPRADWERNYRWNSYSPPKIKFTVGRERYKKEVNGKTQYGKATALWYFRSKTNRQYWLAPQRKRSAPRGVEVGLDFDQEDPDGDGRREGQGGPFGIPAWEQDEPNAKNADPSLWTANFRCAYADDYDSPEPTAVKNELNGQYQLTVGLGCQPRSNAKDYRWTHLLRLKGDAEDRVVGTVQPVHYANSTHIGTVPVLGDRSEWWWCHDNKHDAPGSCRFGDHASESRGVPVIRYRDSFLTPDSIPVGRNVETNSKIVSRIKP